MTRTVCAVTGAGGLVGTTLVAALRRLGLRVRAVDVRPDEGLGRPPDGVERVAADVLDRAALLSAFSGVDVVYHLAARISVQGDPDGSVWAVNVEGVRNACEAAQAAGVRRFVHCSSVHAFDLEHAGEWLDETGARAAADGLPAYDRSKYAGELVVRDAVAGGLDAVVVNPTAVVGPGDRGPSRMGRLLLDLYAGTLPVVIDGGFDFVDVRDVCAALISAAERGRTGEGYLVPGHHATVGELATLAERNGGRPAPRASLPMWLAHALVPLAARVRTGLDPALFTGEALHALRYDPQVDGSKAWNELHHRPRPLAQTVRDTYRWFADADLLTASRPGARRGLLRRSRRRPRRVAAAGAA